jgi:predicted Zn-dependent protease
MEMAFGNTDQALAGARRILERNPSYDPKLRAALILTIDGSASEAESIVNDLVKENPEHTIINSILASIVKAGIALSRNEPTQAIEELEVARPYELGFAAVLAPLFLRAQSFLMNRSAEEAAKEFQRILDHRGSEPFSPFCAIARLGLARAQALAGDTATSLQTYDQFIADWKSADPDIPALLEARQESGGLKSKTSSVVS